MRIHTSCRSHLSTAGAYSGVNLIELCPFGIASIMTAGTQVRTGTAGETTTGARYVVVLQEPSILYGCCWRSRYSPQTPLAVLSLFCLLALMCRLYVPSMLYAAALHSGLRLGVAYSWVC